MGTTCCCVNPLASMGASEWVSLLGIAVNSILAYWIVRTIQNKLTNKRVLKDHFILEMKEIRAEYKTCLNNLYNNKTHPENVIPWFKLMNIKVADLMKLISKKYNVSENILLPYQNELRELITNNDDFTHQFKDKKEKNLPVEFSDNSRHTFIKFQQEHNHIFNDIIVLINDCEK
ncbi:MAG: hypothetical protein M9940_09455 [Bacteroidetes bacterium]|nr:hypothetical protein [Bacteroidota bacterium]